MCVHLRIVCVGPLAVHELDADGDVAMVLGRAEVKGVRVDVEVVSVRGVGPEEGLGWELLRPRDTRSRQ